MGINEKNMPLKGFTLLELIVAMALMNLVAISLYSSMYIGIKARKSCNEALKPYNTVIPVFAALTEDLNSAVIPDGVFADSFKGNDDIQNGSDSIVFYGSNYRPGGNEKASCIVKVEYALEKDELNTGNGFVLMRKLTTNLLLSKIDKTTDEVVSRGIQTFDIEYYDGNAWFDSWDSSTQDNELPKAVQISITLAGHNSTASNNKAKTFKKIVYLSHANRANAGNE